MSTDKRTDEQHRYVYAVEYYPAFKKREILTHATTWRKLEDIVLSRLNQSQEDGHCRIPFTLDS